MEGELKLDNNKVIRTLSIYGDSMKKLYKFVPKNCVKATPYTIADVLGYDLEVNIDGVIFTGKDDNSYIGINSSNRNYTEEELIAFQKILVKCYTYPFGGLEISFGLNIFTNDKTEKTIKALLNQYKIEPLLYVLDSEGHIELRISNVKYFATQSFINFILELQTLTRLLDEKYDQNFHMQ